MVLLATGHQVRCIFRVQVGIFNKGIGFLWGLKALNWIYFVKNTHNQVYVWFADMLKKQLSNDNDYEFLNTQACSFNEFWNRGCTHSLVASHRYWVVPLISTRFSGYSHIILLKLAWGIKHDDVMTWKRFLQITGPLWRESTGDRWITLNDAKFWCVPWCYHELADERIAN